MTKKTKYATYTAVGAFLLIFLISVISFNNYNNSGVMNTSEQKEGISIASSKNNSKNKTNLFLQDKNNPDHILAINPYGSDGVYQYRKQANGDIYPEYKFFDGHLSTKKSNLRVSSTSGEVSKSITLKKSGNGDYQSNSGNKYRELSVSTQNDDSKKMTYDNNGTDSTIEYQGKDPYTDDDSFETFSEDQSSEVMFYDYPYEVSKHKFLVGDKFLTPEEAGITLSPEDEWRYSQPFIDDDPEILQTCTNPTTGEMWAVVADNASDNPDLHKISDF
jgi:hypothetical protein